MNNYQHPVFDTYFQLNTPVLKSVVRQVFLKIALRQTGTIFHGAPRIGKTRCACALEAEIPKKFTHVYVVSVIAVARENARHRSTVINQLLLKESIMVGRYDSGIKQFNMLVDRISGKMRREGKTQLVIIIDELQRFASADFYQLADLMNVFDGQGIRVTIVSFAMPEIVSMVEGFKINEQMQIIARFMSDIKCMTGVQSEKALAEILGLYDMKVTGLDGSAESYTRDFFPKSYGGGWRLSSISPILWREMNIRATGAYVKNLPMEHITTAVRYLFMASSCCDGGAAPISESDILESIGISGFEEFCKIVEVPV